ncbi:MAG: hypothetical protein M1834_002813 [Cirrosporium novae-zelandiae]|nr:MAG: hypothetical protein M1834_002813 [Cirrosporium novae-zelandiae]
MASSNNVIGTSKVIASIASPPESGRSVCPLRRLDRKAISQAIDGIARGQIILPPSHHICMNNFRQNEDLIKGLDDRFGNDQDAMLLSLWETHKPLFERRRRKDKNQAITEWLKRTSTPENLSTDDLTPHEENIDAIDAESSRTEDR